MPSRRRHRVFSASLVVTVAFVPGCDKGSPPPDKPPIRTNNPPAPIDAAPAISAPVDCCVAAAPVDAAPAAPAGPITFDGYICVQGPPGKENGVPCPEDLLPVPPKGAAVAAIGGTFRTLQRKQVRGPSTIVLPSPPSKLDGKTHVSIDEGSFGCVQWQDYSCPKGATCNPPEPTPVACPDDLLPTLAPGVKPSQRKGKDCFLDGNVEVACP